MSESQRDNLILAITSDDDWAFLELQSEETALSKEQVVAMLIRKARKAYENPVPQAYKDVQITAISQEEMDRAFEAQRQREIAEKRRELQAQLAALDGGSIETFDLDPNRPDEFDESLIPRDPPTQMIEHHSHGTVIAPPRNNGVGSLTAPAGIRADLRGGDRIGDPMGNIVRRNFRHLGAG